MTSTRRLPSHTLSYSAALLFLLMTASPDVRPGDSAIALRDDTGREVRLAAPAKRIVSLAPHLTEILFAAGAGERVVGVVAYSDYPEAALRLPQVGGYSNVDMEAVIALKPDLIVAWASGNRGAHLNKLDGLGIPVYVNEIRSFEGVARSLETFGHLAGTQAEGSAAASAFRERRDQLARRYANRPPVRMFYQVWHQPLMTVNGRHLISDAIRLCGGANVFAELATLAPTVGIEGVLAADPEVIVASGSDASRPQWLDEWRRWPSLAASAADNLYSIAPQLIQRHTPRILEGTAQLCEVLEGARAKRTAGTPVR